jgi:phosphatidylethanolamine-binding protein (PEBP) family uncharacterized protein
VHVPASITVDSPDIKAGASPRATPATDRTYHRPFGGAMSRPTPPHSPWSWTTRMPLGGTYTHWVVVDIDPAVKSVARGQSPPGAQQIVNSAGRASYMGPCPPSGVHHYRFTVYALSRRLALPPRAALHSALDAIAEAATAQGRLTCTYQR